MNPSATAVASSTSGYTTGGFWERYRCGGLRPGGPQSPVVRGSAQDHLGGFGARRLGRGGELIRQPKPIADRQFEIEFLGPGVEVLAFTFG